MTLSCSWSVSTSAFVPPEPPFTAPVARLLADALPISTPEPLIFSRRPVDFDVSTGPADSGSPASHFDGQFVDFDAPTVVVSDVHGKNRVRNPAIRRPKP